MAVEPLQQNRVRIVFEPMTKENASDEQEVPQFKLRPERVVFSVPEDNELPSENVRVHRNTRIYTSEGEDIGSAQQFVEALLRTEPVTTDIAKEATPEHKGFVFEQTFNHLPPDQKMYLHKIEPSKLRPVEKIVIAGHAEFDKALFPLPEGRQAKGRVVWHTGKRHTLTIRFGVRSNDGTQCSQVWRVVTQRGRGRSDIFVTPHRMRHAFKISLHESGSWQYGYTDEFAQSPDYERLAARESRHWEIWERPSELAPGLTRAFQIVIPPAAARHPCPTYEKDVTWAEAPRPEEVVEFNVVLTSPARPINGWPGMESMGTKLAGRFELENEEILWVVYRNIARPEFKDLRIPRAYIQSLEIKDDAQYSMVLTGKAEDGSRFMIEAPIDVTSMIEAIKSARSRTE